MSFKTIEEVWDYLDSNGIERPIRKVVGVANKHGDLIICGARHGDGIMNTVYRSLNEVSKAMVKDSYQNETAEEGFIDQWGVFMGREEALGVVKASGQPFDPERNGFPENWLFSEGLH